MKIFKISQNENNGYDTYDSAVVIAESEDEARLMHPNDDPQDNRVTRNSWIKDSFKVWCTKPEQVNVEYLGEAEYSQSIGFICKSFNAG